jgi:hypothetical protein
MLVQRRASFKSNSRRLIVPDITVDLQPVAVLPFHYA